MKVLMAGISIGADAINAALELRELCRESARAIREPRIWPSWDVKPAGQGEIGVWISGILDESKPQTDPR